MTSLLRALRALRALLPLLPCLAFLLSCLELPAQDASPNTSSPRPNIIIIMSDDMGFSDIGCYGSEIHTPHLDSLATNGLRFSQFYNTGRCCPTRASLLTGLYSHQAGIGHMTSNYGLPQYQGYLNQKCLTIAEALRPAGYRTYMTGKWHVTGAFQADGPKETWPLQRGFDKFYGTFFGAGSLFDPNTLARDNTHITPENDPEYQAKDTWYYTDAISDNTVNFIHQHHQNHGDQPFFHYVAYTAAHWPMHALPRDIEKYQGKYNQGYAPIYAARLEKMKALGLIDPAWQIPGPIGNWSQIPLKKWEAACMEVYAAMVDSMDQGIGRIISALRETGQLDNTLILYLQDNGSSAERFGRGKVIGPLERPTAPTLPAMGKDELQTRMIPTQSRDGYPLRRGRGVMPGPPETQIGYGENWANVSNTPFREYKHWVHEGGISTPLIAHWPKGITAKNTWAKDPTHLIDLMATCLDLAKATYPADKIPLEGTSLKPIFNGHKIKRGKPLFWEHEGNRAVRDHDWKIVAKGIKGPWELYNIAKDRTEMHNLAQKHPHRLKTMIAQYETWAKERGVVPFGSWSAKNRQKGSPKESFQLKDGDSLPADKAPRIANRAFSIRAELAQLPAQGVIAAQGGSHDGWALFLKDQALHFSTRRNGKILTATAPLHPNSSPHLTAVITKDSVNLSAGVRSFLTSKGNFILTSHPLDPLETGKDSSGIVGDYGRNFPLSVPLKSLTIELQ